MLFAADVVRFACCISQRRDDAAKAMEAMDGIILHDFELRIGWGKAMTLPAVPCWPGPGEYETGWATC